MSRLEFKPQDRQSIDFAEEERIKSVNLFNKYGNINQGSGWTSGENVLQADGSIKATANYSNGYGKGQIVYLKPKTEYVLSFTIKDI